MSKKLGVCCAGVAVLGGGVFRAIDDVCVNCTTTQAGRDINHIEIAATRPGVALRLNKGGRPPWAVDRQPSRSARIEAADPLKLHFSVSEPVCVYVSWSGRAVTSVCWTTTLTSSIVDGWGVVSGCRVLEKERQS